VFTNQHAYLAQTCYYNDLQVLQHIDWTILQNRDFRRDQDDPKKIERYQAEALIFKHLPINVLLGIVCFDETTRSKIQAALQQKSINLDVYSRPHWYFQ
jgi:hypothetical protein